MKRRTFCGVLAAFPLSAISQPRLYRVAWVTAERRDSPSSSLEALRSGLRDLNYVEGRDLVMDVWPGDGSGERIEAMSGEILASRPDVIVAAGGLPLFALLRAKVTTPIVFSMSGDPVEAKIVESFGRPGGTITGISLFALDLVGKRLEYVKELLPAAKRVAVVANPQHPGERLELTAAKEAASRLGLAVRYFPVTSKATLGAALVDIAKARDDALLAFADGFTLQFAGQIAEFSRRERIPAVDGWAPFAEAGNLMIYGPVISDVYRRLAVYVDKIRKGAKPADLPVERPTKVELVINEAVARQLGIVIPPAVLARADQRIR
jgi:putative ABC transport system substrate-binding protein